jgi:energy-coupling factor transport system substrate-specific component
VNWEAVSLAILAVVILVGFLWYERTRPPARIIALVAALAALAVIGRLAFAAIPNVKPTTDIVLFAGYALGGAPGFAVGAVTAVASNLFLGQGPWTPWQMVAWGGVGVGGALLARATGGRELGRVPLAVACGVAGLAFGAVMDTYQWTFTGGQDLASYGAVSASSLPYNLAHVVGNVVFCLLIGPAFVRTLRRFRRRFEVRWEPRRQAQPSGAAGAAATALALVVATSAVVSLAAAPAAKASATSDALGYLQRAQNSDGGFGGAPGQGSTQLYTGWTALGIAAAGVNPRDLKRGDGNTVSTYIRKRAGQLNDTGELERTILVLRASGLNPRSFEGRDLVRQLLGRRRGGSFGGLVNHTAFGILALRAAGLGRSSGVVRAAARWLEREQNRDGGWGFSPRAASDVDDTGAVLQALGAAGRGGRTVSRAVGYLRGVRSSNGGYGQMKGRSANAQSTAWAVQGLVAVGRGVGSSLSYLRSLQAGDGSVRYSRTSRQTPVWVTAQALAAFARKAFPLAPVKKRGARAAAARAGGSAANGGGVGGGDPAAGEAGADNGGTGASGGSGAGGTPGAPGAPGTVPAGLPGAQPGTPASYAGRPAPRDGVGEGSPLAALIAALAAAGCVLGVRRHWLRRWLHRDSG